MKLAVAILASLAGAAAFAPPASTSHRRTTISSPTTLYQFGTLGFDTEGLYTAEEEKLERLRVEVQKYVLPLRAPTAIKSDLGTSVLISGFGPTDPASTEILDFLNDEDSPHFPFTKIVAHVEDVKLAKKRMIGRTARYTGLLDKLDFSEGASLPSAEQLAGVSSWVAHVSGGDLAKLDDIAAAAEAAESVKNVVILVSGATGASGDALKGAEAALKEKATTFAYTLLVVPEWNDEPEATTVFGIANVTDVVDAPFAAGETFSREESLRIISECLAIEKAAGRCVVANTKETNSLEDMMITSMREIGFSRIEEVELMVTSGAKGYNDMIEAEKEGIAAWEKAPEMSEEEKAALAATEEERRIAARDERRNALKQEELAVIATKWAKKEYLRRNLKRVIPVREEEFIEIVWDRAMFEADLQYRTMQGESVNESEEREQFKEVQKQKKAAAYKAEKERWTNMNYDELDPKEDNSISLGRL